MKKYRTYPLEMAELEPEKYWIDPIDGACKERGEEQFFISNHGSIHAVTKKEYLLKLRYHCHNPTSIKSKKPNEKKPSIIHEGDGNPDKEFLNVQ